MIDLNDIGIVKNDPRILRTQNLLAKALIALTLEQGYESITIRDITERSSVGYATFFRHYTDKEALLQDVLRVFVEELTARLAFKAEGADLAVEGKLIFEYVQEQQVLCRLLLASHGQSAILQSVQQFHSRIPSLHRINSAPGKIPVAIAIHHWQAATLALIEWWLQNEMLYPPQSMGEIYRDLIAQPTLALLGR